MSPQKLASKLAVWSKRSITYEQGLVYAKAYLNGTIGDGLVKDYFTQTFPLESVCRVPTCLNPTVNTKYCKECYALTPNSTASGLLKAMGELLWER